MADANRINFPVFGLEAPALSPRWLAMFGPGSGNQIQGITLAHGPLDRRTEPWIDVTTAVRQGPPPSGWSAADWDWYNTGHDVLVRGDVHHDSADGRAWRRLADAFNADHEAHYRQWSKHDWIVNGNALPARSISVGDDYWAGLCVDHPDVLILVSGGHVPPEPIVLATTAGDGYGVDLGKPLHFPGSVHASRAAARTDGAFRRRGGGGGR